VIKIKLFGIDGCDDCDIQKNLLSRMGAQYKFFDISNQDLETIDNISKHEISDIPTIVIELNGKTFQHSGVLAVHKIQEAIKFLG